MAETGNILHLGLYSEQAWRVIKTCMDNTRRAHWISSRCFTREPNGELVYRVDDESYSWHPNFNTEDGRNQAKREFATALLKAAKHIIYVEDFDTSSYDGKGRIGFPISPAKIRGSELKTRELNYKREPETKFTLEQIIFLVEWLQGYKTHKNLCKAYSEDFTKSFISQPNDTFTTGTLTILMEQMNGLRKQMNEAISKKQEEQREEMSQLRASWEKKIAEVKDQMEQLQALSKQDVAAAG